MDQHVSRAFSAWCSMQSSSWAVPQALLTERRWRALNIIQRFNDGSNDAFRLLGQRRAR